MADTICLVCSHGPHTGKKCSYCKCEAFMNAELMASRALVQINNMFAEKIPIFEGMVFDITEIIAEAFPDAVKAVDARREERRRQIEILKAQQEAEASQQHGAEADQEGQDAGAGSGDGPQNPVSNISEFQRNTES